MSVDGRAIANFVLDFCDEKSRGITNLSLQKIVYFCHVWSLIQLRRPLVKHQFEAWQYGPVLQYLYREFKNYDDRPIESRASRINVETGVREIVPYRFDAETEELLGRVVDFYSRLRPGDLVALSHAKGGPWDEVWNHRGVVNPGMQIDESSIANFYSKAHPPFSIQ
jgi:uncharacterized phage-associated protein